MSKYKEELMVWIIQFGRRKTNTANILSLWNLPLHLQMKCNARRWSGLLLLVLVPSSSYRSVLPEIRPDCLFQNSSVTENSSFRRMAPSDLWRLQSLCGLVALPNASSSAARDDWLPFCLTVLRNLEASSEVSPPVLLSFSKQTSSLPFIILRESLLLLWMFSSLFQS